MYILKLLKFMALWFFLSGFVLLTGPQESKIKTSEDKEAFFVWNGTSPIITDLDDFRGGTLNDINSADVMQSILQLVMSIWSNIPGTSITLVLSDDIDSDAETDRDDFQNSIVVKESTSLSSAAFAIVNFDESQANPNRNYIMDCDISISSRAVTASELAFTLLHEFGHCLGLGHNHLSSSSVMSYAATRESLDLDLDDKLGILYLYPNEENDQEVKEILPCGVINSHNLKGTQNSAAILLLLLSPAFIVFISFISGNKKRAS